MTHEQPYSVICTASSTSSTVTAPLPSASATAQVSTGTTLEAMLTVVTSSSMLTSPELSQSPGQRSDARPVVTEITKASEFYPGEDYHQDYLVKNPGGYNCHVLRD